MTPEETRILLSEVAAVDNRKQSLDAAHAWHKVLGRYTLAQCRDALVVFWRNRPDDYLKPGHLADIIVTLSPSDTPPESALGRVAADAATVLQIGRDPDEPGGGHHH